MAQTAVRRERAATGPRYNSADSAHIEPKRVIPAQEPVRKSIRIECKGRPHSEKNRWNESHDRILPNGGHGPAEKNRVGVLVVRVTNFLTNSCAGMTRWRRGNEKSGCRELPNLARMRMRGPGQKRE